jgi:hypothetical protein
VQVCERTAADKKGGHLARRKSDGKLMLRESAMCPDAGELGCRGLGCTGLRVSTQGNKGRRERDGGRAPCAPMQVC